MRRVWRGYHRGEADVTTAQERREEDLQSKKTKELYDAIVEGRRDDAVAILNDMTGSSFRSVALQRNLFPDRVPT